MRVMRDRPGHSVGREALRWFAVVVLIAGVARSGSAGSEERKATAGASELLIPFGARGTVLGASVVGDVQGVDALYWNPAGLAAAQRTEAMFGHTTYFAGMQVNDAGVAAPWAKVGTVALSAKVLSVGEFIQTTESAPEGTGNTFDPTFTVLGLSYARQFTDRVRFGATMNYLNERVLDNSAQGVAFDFGVQYDPDWRGFRFGLVMKNFGPSMQFRGPGFDVDLRRPDADPSSTNRAFSTTSAAFDLPSLFVVGATYDVYHHGPWRLAAKGAFQNNDFVGDQLWGAMEWSWRDQLSLRGSWFGSSTASTDPVTGAQGGGFRSGDDLYEGWALGAGADVRMGDSRVGVDFAWRPLRALFDDIVEFGVRVRF